MAKIEEIIYNILEDKWHKSFDDDVDPFDAWQKTLKEHGCIEQISVEANWNEDHGVPRLIRSLIKIINEKDKYLVTGDPVWEVVKLDTWCFHVWTMKNENRKAT